MNLRNLSFDELTSSLAALDPPRAGVLKLFATIHARGATSLAQIRATPDIPRRVKDLVCSCGALDSLAIVERRRARDGFVKYLFESPLGGRFEAVRIPIFDEKFVVCVSSQVGCALACDFCMTGRMGFARNLRTWEILDQVRQIREEADRPVRGVVFMGMGEPLLNYDDVMRAAEILAHPAGYSIAAKSITISTVGIVPAIRRYTRERRPYRLAFSVTSAIPEKRRRLLPVDETHPLPSLVEAIREHAIARRQRAMIAYVLMRGVNMDREDAEALRDAFRDVPIKIDLIEVTDPSGRYQPPTAAELSTFRDHLRVVGAPVVRRYSGGREIGAACGTLAASSYGGKVLRAMHRRTPAAIA